MEDLSDVTPYHSPVEVFDDDSNIEGLQGSSSYASDPNSPNNPDDYEVKFIKATKKGNWDVMKDIIETCDRGTLTIKGFPREGTALHHTLLYGQDRVGIAKGLVELMSPKDLETTDEEGYTALALAVLLHHDDDLLGCMITKNPKLLEFGPSDKIPVIVASSKGFTDTTLFLYRKTPIGTLSIGARVNLLNQCISLNLYGFARQLLKSSPALLWSTDDHGVYPTHALAKAIVALQNSNIQHKQSGGWKQMLSNFGDHIMNCWLYIFLDDWKRSPVDQESISIREAYELLQWIIQVKDFDYDINDSEFIREAMMEAAKHGIIKFINEMLKVDRELISINNEGKNMFLHAITNRQEKVFNLIYAFPQNKDMLLSFYLDDEGNLVKPERTEKIPNILHFAAQLPPHSVLDRFSNPALKMQREIQWFKAVEEITVPRYREELNGWDKRPYDFFMETHKKFLEEGETFMKTTAIGASAVNGLIVSTMFAATFAVISGINRIETSDLSRDRNVFFIVFLILSALPLCLCTFSTVVFLGVLTSRYSPEDFLSSLPRKLMVGFWLLSGAIPTMMGAFSCALYIMLKGQTLHFVIIPIFLFSLLPVVGFFIYICPLLWKINRYTNEPIFDRVPVNRKPGREGTSRAQLPIGGQLGGRG